MPERFASFIKAVFRAVAPNVAASWWEPSELDSTQALLACPNCRGRSIVIARVPGDPARFRTDIHALWRGQCDACGYIGPVTRDRPLAERAWNDLPR
jgi:DNA-directed RNA polymerase subunit RPC12/RpoP